MYIYSEAEDDIEFDPKNGKRTQRRSLEKEMVEVEVERAIEMKIGKQCLRSLSQVLVSKYKRIGLSAGTPVEINKDDRTS